MASSEQMEGGPRGSTRKKEIIKEPALSRVLKFMYMCIEIMIGTVYMTKQ